MTDVPKSSEKPVLSISGSDSKKSIEDYRSYLNAWQTLYTTGEYGFPIGYKNPGPPIPNSNSTAQEFREFLEKRRQALQNILVIPLDTSEGKINNSVNNLVRDLEADAEEFGDLIQLKRKEADTSPTKTAIISKENVIKALGLIGNVSQAVLAAVQLSEGDVTGFALSSSGLILRTRSSKIARDIGYLLSFAGFSFFIASDVLTDSINQLAIKSLANIKEGLGGFINPLLSLFESKPEIAGLIEPPRISETGIEITSGTQQYFNEIAKSMHPETYRLNMQWILSKLDRAPVPEIFSPQEWIQVLSNNREIIENSLVEVSEFGTTTAEQVQQLGFFSKYGGVIVSGASFALPYVLSFTLNAGGEVAGAALDVMGAPGGEAVRQGGRVSAAAVRDILARNNNGWGAEVLVGGSKEIPEFIARSISDEEVNRNKKAFDEILELSLSKAEEISKALDERLNANIEQLYDKLAAIKQQQIPEQVRVDTEAQSPVTTGTPIEKISPVATRLAEAVKTMEQETQTGGSDIYELGDSEDEFSES
jgi:hypothetical protein